MYQDRLSERRDNDALSEALVVFEPASGGIVYVNAAASELFGVTSERPGETRATDLIPELADPSPRTFSTYVPYADGERLADVIVEPLGAGQLARGVAVVARVRLQPLAPEPLPSPVPAPHTSLSDGGLNRLESLWGLVVRGGFAGTDQFGALLSEAALGVGLQHATLGRVEGHDLAVVFADDPTQIGQRTPLERTAAGTAVRRTGAFAVVDTAQVPEFASLSEGARSFLASAFRVGDELWVLTLFSTTPRQRPFTETDWNYVETVVQALARAIERSESDRRIERLAYHDGLTSLPNRIALLDRMDQAIESAAANGTRIAVLFLDIDGFKSVNDTVGHRGGDAVLTEIAHRLRGTLRRDEFIGRLGGDEFAIVMPNVGDRQQIDSIAQRIGGVLTMPFSMEEFRFSLSASIGVAIYPDDATSREDLLACADAAMYAAKEDGGSRVRFRDPAPMRTMLKTSTGATTALASETRDTGYVLCYQPIVDPASGKVLAAEALIRRIHPQHGLLAPERGWSIARDEEGRRALDRWVLREAANQVRAWQKDGIALELDVNLAAFDPREIDALFDDPALASAARRLRVELEPKQFTNGSVERVGRFVEHCKRHGVPFALDGFDGAISTLSSFADMPIEAVKLDRPLVEGIVSSKTTRAVVVGTIIVAKSLGWSVIAKGVETSAQQDALLALGSDAIQGYYVAHPMTAADFGNWLRSRELVERRA